MKQFLILLIAGLMSSSILFTFSADASVQPRTEQDTSEVLIPIYLQIWHEKISNEQKKADLFDGKEDQKVKVSEDADINKKVTKAIYSKVNKMRRNIEKSSQSKRLQIFYLNSIYQMLKHYNLERTEGILQPKAAIVLIDNFSKMLQADQKGESIAPFVKGIPYDIANINVIQFSQNYGYKKARTALLRLYSKEHPEHFLATLNQNYPDLVDAPFIDSTVAQIARTYPVSVYNFATSYTPLGRKIRHNPDRLVQTIVQVGASGKAIRLLPFVDYIVDSTYTISHLKKVASDENAFYRLSVKTLMDMNKRKLSGDQPIGLKAMEYNVRKRAMRYIRMVNELHESSDRVRFAVANKLTPQEIYYVLVNGQEEIYTSSFVGLYHRMMDRMKPHTGDELLMSLVFDHFRKFITLSAAYNTLNTFLETMKPANSSLLMRKFVTGLQNTEGLEDAVDVADAFGSIKDKELLNSLQQQVNLNFQKMESQNDKRGKVIYGLLATLFNTRNTHSKAEDWADNMADKLNLPPLDYIPYKELTDADGRIFEEVFFYGDKDGFASYRSFMTSFRNGDWHIKDTKYWVKITSRKGKPITIFAKKPMQTEDEVGMQKLQDYLAANNINPTIFIHRGHSYHVKASIAELQSSAKLVMLGSCGGYNSLANVLNVAPNAQIITSKQTGSMGVNEPIIRTIERHVREGKDLHWESIWNQLNAHFKGSPHYYQLFQDYIPPQENLGAVFIKAYKKLIHADAPVDNSTPEDDVTPTDNSDAANA